MFQPRHHAREVALQILYRYDIGGENLTAGNADSAPLEAARITVENLKQHFDHFHVPHEARQFAAELVSGTLSHLKEIDAQIEAQGTSWKISRMNYVDRCLLRLSTYELLYRSENPASVVIDEAVELAKHFGNSETGAFVNGVLDGIRKKASA